MLKKTHINNLKLIVLVKGKMKLQTKRQRTKNKLSNKIFC